MKKGNSKFKKNKKPVGQHTGFYNDQLGENASQGRAEREHNLQNRDK